MTLAKNITVIPATRKVGTRQVESTNKLRVAAYCRVSTEMEEQESSYEVQVEHYTSYINSKAEWEFVGIYADDGISGTNTKKRSQFNKMIEDCREGKIDMILTKSISRFSRNTVDCLKYTRELKDLNIAVYFEKEGINTLDAKGEVLMTIMAAMAQQESESMSQNIRMGIQFRNQQGKVKVNHNRFLGYTKDEDGRLIIVPEEAAIVQRIYAEYMGGASLLKIRRGLEADGILNGAHNARWHESNIRQILTNEKYLGDALLQKTYTKSVLDKKRCKNEGQLPKYYVEGAHEGIIDKDVFLRVQAEMTRRASLIGRGKRRVYNCKYALSGVVRCGLCGDVFRRIKWNNHGCKSTVWRCVSRVEKGGPDCQARTMKESVLQAAVVMAVNEVMGNKDYAMATIKRNLQVVIGGEKSERIAEVDRLIHEKQEALLKAGTDDDKVSAIGEEIVALRDEKQELMSDNAKIKGLKDRVEELDAFIDRQPTIITEYSEDLVRRLIEAIIVYDDRLVVKFKSGIAVDIDA